MRDGIGKKRRRSGNRIIRIVLVSVLLIAAASSAVLLWSVHDPAGFNGALKVQSGRIVNRFGIPYVLQGVSTFSLHSHNQYLDKKGFKELRDKWNVNCIRLNVKTYGDGGYCTGDDKFRAEMDSTVDWGVQCATECGMYVIIDWHILDEKTPNKYRKHAVRFFSKMAGKYKNNDNVMFEICNEPNGDTDWPEIKKYAELVIKEIRNKNNRSLVIVGTPQWCQRVTDPIGDPVIDLNTAYSCHFYAATHRDEYRDILKEALDAKIPVVVTEFGITKHTGDGELAPNEGEKWLQLLDQYKVGRVCWNLSSGKASSCLFKQGCQKTNSWEDQDLSEHGKWIREQYTKNMNRW